MVEHWEFLVGIAVQTVLFLFGGYGMVLRNDWSNKAMGQKLTGLEAELKKLAEVVVMQAVQTNQIFNLNNQMTMLQRNVEDLRRGSGWITGHRTSVDGEYP